MTAGGEGVQVHGGPGGITAQLEEMDVAGTRLARLAHRLTELAAELVGRAGDPWLLLSATYSPCTSARAAEALAAVLGPRGLPGQAAQLAVLAEATRGAVRAYRAVDGAAARLVALAHDGAMLAAVRALPVLVLVAAPLVRQPGVPRPGAREADRWLWDHPEVIAAGADGLDGGLLGATGLDLPGVALLATASALAGRPFPPRDERDALAVLAGLARLTGRLGDPPVEVRSVEPVGPAAAPYDLDGLVAGLVSLDHPVEDPGRVRVLEVIHGDGSRAWVVQVAGTQAWSPIPGSNPHDLSSDVALMSAEGAALAAGVATALARAQAASAREHPRDTSGEPVLLMGHSQGGITAAAVASNAEVTAHHAVTHVLTLGAPVRRFPVADGVQVLSVEHRQDPVVHLDGGANPDRPDWRTVTLDLAALPGAAASAGGVPDARGSAAHDRRRYADSLHRVRAEHEVRAWEQGAAAFLVGPGGSAVVHDYRLSRRLSRDRSPARPVMSPGSPTPRGSPADLGLPGRREPR